MDVDTKNSNGHDVVDVDGNAGRPDVDQVTVDQCIARELPWVRGLRRPGFQTVMRQSVLNEIHRHGKSVENTEICGVLVGNLYHDDKGPFLYVEHSIRGEHASNESCNVTFTDETWNHINSVMDLQYPDKRILGWYHTHPGFGIFLSDMDLFIHRNFFNLSWQVAFVYDPQSEEEGLFQWRHGETERKTFLLERDANEMILESPAMAARANIKDDDRGLVEGDPTPMPAYNEPASVAISDAAASFARAASAVAPPPPQKQQASHHQEQPIWITIFLWIVAFVGAMAYGLLYFFR
jgi:proteasome lid subunit RPN8/RPN11